MANATKKAIIETLLSEHGSTFAEECGIELRDAGEPLFRILVASMLAGAPVRPAAAAAAARSLFAAGFGGVAAMRASRSSSRLRALRDAGYPRFTERAARAAGAIARWLDDEYHGDVRNVRAEAAGDPSVLTRLLKGFEGVGATAASVFIAEVQLLWDELFPAVTERALHVAERLGLPASRLATLVDAGDLPRFVAALARCDPADVLSRATTIRLRAAR
ncbi:MAG: hypothetical protein ABR552_10355 [Actinomycetota bacterium]